MKTTTVKCDSCGSDLTTTGNCDDYMIVVSSERIPSCGGAVTLMNIEPCYDRDYHFCNHNCFREWMLKEIGGNAARQQSTRGEEGRREDVRR